MENTGSPSVNSKLKLFVKAGVRFILAILCLGVIFFVSAGSLDFWNAWLYLAAMFLPMIFTLTYLLMKDPLLLEKRMSIKEKEKAQKQYVKISILFFIASFIVPGLDFRFGWSSVPLRLVIAATILFLLGYALFVAVMMQNSYASRVIEIQENQKVIDTGLYSVIRHPMYMAAMIIYLSSPLILGSYYALIPMVVLPLILAYRIINEEKVLIDGLAGYGEYMKKVKYRLIPFIW